MEGPLSKWTNVMQGWQYRWFVLDEKVGTLSYYISKEKMSRGMRRGCIRLRGAYVGIEGDEDDATFAITSDGKTLHLQGKDLQEREKWIRAVEDVIKDIGEQSTGYPSSHPVPTALDFDSKLSETDSYLQILIDQMKTVNSHVEHLLSEDEKLARIVSTGNAFMESVKHSIVLLQIAKSTVQPFDPTNRLPPLVTPHLGITIVRDIEKDLSSSHSDISVSEQSLHEVESASSLVYPGTITLPVPETSYSSSEDEDFYDAYEISSSVSGTPIPRLSTDEAGPARDPSFPLEPSTTRPSLTADGIDIDTIYEDGEEDELGSMEGHGSVISHLASQVKIGMDLTKVVLPTFILERRSLLEMYADFFAHPDIFVRIADLRDPRERMIQVVRWYLSAFHAGRRSEVAKKPYNPILGESFQCWWDVPGAESTNADCARDGPVPWCTKKQLTFVAEQVSHHPPVSAFYAEHYEKRISFCAHIWTKSKFLGLSVGVHHVGEGTINVLDYGEDYVITFPSAYGRSILTVPWIELGGAATITCAKTGYSANIDFQTKPFYGGKKNRVTCDVFQLGDKKPIVNIQGEWNGGMVAKWSDGNSEDFIDVRRLDIVKKQVRRVADQAERESRRLWQEVTIGLKHNDIPRATASKLFIEQRQRLEAKERADATEKWKTQHFNEAGAVWSYKCPLQSRLRR